MRHSPGTPDLRRLLLPLLAVIGACAKGVEPPTSGPPSASTLAGAPARSFPSIDDDFAQIAEQAPGFGGMYLDSAGRLVVWMTSLAESTAAVRAIQSVHGGSLFRSTVGRIEPPALVFRLGSFDFRLLKQWRDWFRAGAWTPGMTLLDIDEATNRLRVGVENGAALTALTNRLADARIPRDAVIVEFLSAPIAESTLRDRFRPIPGAVQVQGTDGRPRAVWCTAMVNAVTGLGPGFIASSHCTWRFGNIQDGTVFHQPASYDTVGREAADGDIAPPGQSCPGQDGCRWSDAAFIVYTAGGLNEQGKVARTYLNSIVIDPSSPRFLLNEPSFSHLMVGDPVNKIGKTTGWRQGHVTATCTDAPWTVWSQGDTLQVYLLCQYLGDYYSEGGDSGSPVFTWTGSGDRIDLRGIHNGRYTPDLTRRVFSPWLYIVLELDPYTGGLDVAY